MVVVDPGLGPGAWGLGLGLGAWGPGPLPRAQGLGILGPGARDPWPWDPRLRAQAWGLGSGARGLGPMAREVSLDFVTIIVPLFLRGFRSTLMSYSYIYIYIHVIYSILQMNVTCQIPTVRDALLPTQTQFEG